jgi:hypothetical protein
MPQNGTDLVQSGAGTQHHGRDAVPKEIGAVGWRILDARAAECGTNDAGNDHSRPQGAEGCLGTEKQAVDGDLWACLFNVIQNRVSCVLW